MSGADSSRPKRERLEALIAALPAVRVAVLGDAVLDRFVHGEIARVSREAPVLILDQRELRLAPGGAGNTAANLAALDVKVRLCGRIGADAHGEELARLLDGLGVDTAGLVTSRSYVTPTKTRILAGSPHTAKQQIVRIDQGADPAPPAAAVRRRLLSRAATTLRRGAALLVADYGYGGVDPGMVGELGPLRGPATLDSRFRLSEYRGVDAATPNLEELERAAGRRLADDDERGIESAARRLRRRLGARALLVTRGSWGMSLVTGARDAIRIPVFGSDEIADVTGAGDTVIAVFTAVRAAGGSWREAAELANVAGGLVVMKRGTATVSRGEVIDALAEGWETA